MFPRSCLYLCNVSSPFTVPMFLSLCFIPLAPSSSVCLSRVRVVRPPVCLSPSLCRLPVYFDSLLSRVQCVWFCFPCVVMFIHPSCVPMCFLLPNHPRVYTLCQFSFVPCRIVCLILCIPDPRVSTFLISMFLLSFSSSVRVYGFLCLCFCTLASQ